MHVHRLPVSVLICAAALAGCGGGSANDDDVRLVAARFYEAVGHGDGAGACSHLSQDAVKQLESQEGRSCEQAITDVELEGGAITSVQVYVTNAQVITQRGERAFLGRETDGWKLSAVGCKPDPQKPSDRPADCEVEA